ncbi:YczE/YyaS/YitT family protein [Sporolactobacillus vineae]|uniref:YczE/YyaS/YitT family protein n=1 Tax=Sporolactobacillus vineae TaxID=444463 RepID=UPI0002897709|nr:membrane protein [Sporolactobacillus vineae]
MTSITIHHENSLQIRGRISYFLISIVFNALGNALTVAINLGSALWTASAVNLMHFAAVPLDVMLFVFGIAVIFINVLILRRLEWQRVIGNIIFMIPFSYLTGYMTQLLLVFNINLLPLPVRIMLDLIGICFIAVGISIYQRVNLILHPCDDLMQIIRFKYFNGSATIAQLVTFAPPIVIVAITWFLSGRIYAINIGTVFALLFQGTLVGLSDRCIFPTLKHQHLIGRHAGSN